jgi:hypothetical protein
MDLRKTFNFPDQKQLELLRMDSNYILKNCDAIASNERKELRENQEMRDGTCPVCKAKKPDVVNRIISVHGVGNIKGRFRFGFGYFNVSTIINTVVVNHCNKCGNEWEKFKTKSISETDILRVCLNYLAEIINDPNEKKNSWKLEAIEVFEGCYAETIYAHALKQKDYLRQTTVSSLSISKLRRYYKSIYDCKAKN